MVGLDERAKILSEALPYILKYKDTIIVVKYGGNAMVDENLKAKVMEDVVMLSSLGMKVVLVHGGGPEISSMLKKVGKESKFVNGLRVTDSETADRFPGLTPEEKSAGSSFPPPAAVQQFRQEERLALPHPPLCPSRGMGRSRRNCHPGDVEQIYLHL